MFISVRIGYVPESRILVCEINGLRALFFIKLQATFTVIKWMVRLLQYDYYKTMISTYIESAFTMYKPAMQKSNTHKSNRHNFQMLHFLMSFLLCLICIPVNAATWNVDDYTLDQEDLLDGDIQTFEKDFSSGEKEGEKKGVMGVILIKAPYEKVWGVISDWEKQSDFVPGVEYFKVKHVFPGGGEKTWRSIVEGKLDISFISLSYTLDTNFDKAAGTMVWNMLSKEDIKKYQAQKIDVNIADEDRLKNVEGFGKIKTYDEKNTVYYYAPIVETSVSLPGFVESAITNVSLSKYLHAIKERAENK